MSCGTELVFNMNEQQQDGATQQPTATVHVVLEHTVLIFCCDPVGQCPFKDFP